MTAYYNEIDPKTAAWLRELIKVGLIADGEVDTRSIVDVRPADLRGFSQCHFFAGIGGWSYALRLAGWSDDRSVWTGSCPCQRYVWLVGRLRLHRPASRRGLHRSVSDDRRGVRLSERHGMNYQANQKDETSSMGSATGGGRAELLADLETGVCPHSRHSDDPDFCWDCRQEIIGLLSLAAPPVGESPELTDVPVLCAHCETELAHCPVCGKCEWRLYPLAASGGDQGVRAALRELARDIGTVYDVAQRRSDPDADTRAMLLRLDQWRQRVFAIVAALLASPEDSERRKP